MFNIICRRLTTHLTSARKYVTCNFFNFSTRELFSDCPSKHTAYQILCCWKRTRSLGDEVESGKYLYSEEIRENLETQLSELESLESVFCNPGEIRVEDYSTLSDVKSYVHKRSTYLPQYLDLAVKVLVDHVKFELCVTLPHNYPHVEPEIFVRNHELNRSQHVQLNKDLCEYVAGLERGEPCIFSAVSWLQDNAQNYVVIKEEPSSQEVQKKDRYIRYWIYSHHIYSKTKRREIQDLANLLHINGFCMPGKPGIICVEGTVSDCNEWWQSIKSMNWKKIFCKVTEEDKGEEGTFRKFGKFEEVVFQSSGVKCNHMDMGELHKYLDQHKLGYIFKDIFGVEARVAS